MKTLSRIIFLTVALVSISGWASLQPKSLEFACVTQFPTTSFIADMDNGRVKVNMINHNGIKFMPIHSGLVTINDLKILTERAEILANIGEQAQFFFDLENCELHDDTTFSCYRGGTINGIDGKQIEIFALSSSLHQLKFSDLVFNQTTILMGLLIDQKTYYVQMEYQYDECGFSTTRR